MTEPREVEAKFAADEEALERLLELSTFAGFVVTRQPPKGQDDLYFDTPAFDLRASGSSLRIRRKGTALLMTFKGDRVASAEVANMVSRLEDEVVLEGVDSPALERGSALHLEPEPSPLQRARRIALDQDLLPSARMQTNRTVLDCRHPDGREVELAVDRCVATRMADGRTVEFVEVEAELKRGDTAALMAAVNELMLAVPGLRASTETKLERALG